MKHICVSKIVIIGLDNVTWLAPSVIVSLETNFSEIFVEIYTFLFKEMHLKMSSGKWQPFCLGLNVLTTPNVMHIFCCRGRKPKMLWCTSTLIICVCAHVHVLQNAGSLTSLFVDKILSSYIWFLIHFIIKKPGEIIQVHAALWKFRLDVNKR